MTTTHQLRNIESQKVEEINFEDETPSIAGGFKNNFVWSVTGMLEDGINLQNGRPNGQFVEYRAQFKIDPKENKVYGAKNMKVFNLANAGADPSDEYNDGDLHKGTVTGKSHQFTLYDIKF